MLNVFRGARSAPPKSHEHGRFAVRRRHQWRRGYENGAGGETPQTVAPTRIAGRCGLRRRRKGASALSRTVFVPRSPCVPTVPAVLGSCRKPGSQAATGPFWGWVGQGCHPAGKSRTNGLTGANSGEPGREALLHLPPPYYIAISGPCSSLNSLSAASASCAATVCSGSRHWITIRQ